MNIKVPDMNIKITAFTVSKKFQYRSIYVHVILVPAVLLQNFISQLTLR